MSTRLRRAEIKELARKRPCRVVVGANGIFQEGWIPTEKDTLNLLKPEDWERYFEKDWIDAILAEHVWHTLTEEEAYLAAKVCYPYLKPGGYLRVAVPDALRPDPHYLYLVSPGGPYQSIRMLYGYREFSRIFESAGFRVELLEYYDENGMFHHRDWDPELGMIHCSERYDRNNQDGNVQYTSIILGAWK